MLAALTGSCPGRLMLTSSPQDCAAWLKTEAGLRALQAHRALAAGPQARPEEPH